jgi:CheY-like chemotaxis protein
MRNFLLNINALTISGIFLEFMKIKRRDKMHGKKKRILVVDDDVTILKVFKKTLEKEGYSVETVDTGKAAIERIKKEKFNVCLIDVKLPDMDGTELLLKLANKPETIKIIITGFSTDEVGKKAADYGADDFLVKPVKLEELIETVRERLVSKQSEK